MLGEEKHRTSGVTKISNISFGETVLVTGIGATEGFLLPESYTCSVKYEIFKNSIVAMISFDGDIMPNCKTFKLGFGVNNTFHIITFIEYYIV